MLTLCPPKPNEFDTQLSMEHGVRGRPWTLKTRSIMNHRAENRADHDP